MLIRKNALPKNYNLRKSIHLPADKMIREIVNRYGVLISENTPEVYEEDLFDSQTKKRIKSIEKELWVALKKAREHKRGTQDEHRFEMLASENIHRLAIELALGVYQPSPGIAFIVTDPVRREIFAAPFRDRVVHHLLYNASIDFWENHLEPDAYSCRKGKGTLYAAERLKYHINKVAKTTKEPVWVLQGDISGFFMSMDHQKIFERVKWGLDRQFPKGQRGWYYRMLVRTWKVTIDADPTEKVRIRGSRRDWIGLPDDKSLFKQPKTRGIVIGNLTSQLISNIFLGQLDRFIRYDLGYKHYGRYVDDFYIVVPESQKDRVLADVKQIREYLADELGLKLHPKKIKFQPAKHGIKFVGFVAYPNKIVPGPRLIKNARKEFRLVASGHKNPDVVISYLGLMKNTQADGILKRLFDEVGWDYHPLIDPTDSPEEIVRKKMKYYPRAAKKIERGYKKKQRQKRNREKRRLAENAAKIAKMRQLSLFPDLVDEPMISEMNQKKGKSHKNSQKKAKPTNPKKSQNPKTPKDLKDPKSKKNPR